MESINQTFLRVLLNEKCVSICTQQFVALHHNIFPCLDDFEKFLQSDTDQEQKECTKRIVQNLLFSCRTNLCPDIFEALIETESNYPVSNAAFIPQDHVIHSVNVYLLGVFLYFNHQLLHDKLNEFFSEIECPNTLNLDMDATEVFIDSWKVFALCHDIGYPFEKLLSSAGEAKGCPKPISKYIDFSSRIEYDEAVKSLAVCILATCICDRSNKTINSLFQRLKIEPNNWELINQEEETGSRASSNKLVNDDELNKYVKLYGVQSFQDAVSLSPLISVDGLVFFARSNINNSYYFFKMINNSIYCYKRRNADAPNKGFILAPPDDYEIEVYCKDPEMELSRNCTYYDFTVTSQEDWKEVAKGLGEDIVEITTKRYYTCHDALVDIYQKVHKYYNYSYSSMSYEDVKAEKVGNKKILKKCLLDDIGSIVDDCDGGAENLREAFDNAIKGISELLSKETYQKEIVNRMTQINNQETSVLQTFHNTLKADHYCLKNIRKKVLKKKPILFHKKTSAKKCVISMTPLTYTNPADLRNFSECCDGLSSKIANNLKQMGIISDDKLLPVQQYKRDWCAFDHGVLSTHLLLYLVAWRTQCKEQNKHSFINISIKNAEALKDATYNSDVLAEILSAVLVHNIYPSEYKKSNNIDFCLSFDNHPLAYFGALCDSLQIWDRRLSADQSRVTIKDFNPTRHQIAIAIKRNSIVFTVETDNPKKTAKVQRDEMDKFLKGASPLIKFNIIEAPV